MAGAPIGNQNGRKGKMWASAIEQALERRGQGNKMAALSELADKLLAKCDEMDMSALKELGDRLDGKPAQAIVGDPDNPLNHVFGWKQNI